MISTRQLETMIITSDPKEGASWEAAGVDIIFIDLEKIGKQARQGHVDSVKSNHSINDIKPMKQSLSTSKLLVRINPWHESTSEEVEAVIAGGADIIMLPMFQTVEEVEKLANLVNGRCLLYPLIETVSAVKSAKGLAKLDNVWGYHFGLNDLHLEMGMKFMFEVMLWDDFKVAINEFCNQNINFGIGGVTQLGQGALPSELVLSENFRLGSQRVILSRSFKKEIGSPAGAKLEVSRLKTSFVSFSDENLDKNMTLFHKKVEEMRSYDY